MREHTGVHLHTDLIVGLPGESVQQFAAGFDQLYSWRPQEIQVGVLKRLRGAPIARHTAEWGMVYSPRPPYEVLQTSTISFDQMQRLKRFARYWELVANSGNYRHTLPLLLPDRAAYARFGALSQALWQRFGRSHGIASGRLVQALFEHGVATGVPQQAMGRALIDDLLHTGRLPLPELLRPFATEQERKLRKARRAGGGGRERQLAHGSAH